MACAAVFSVAGAQPVAPQNVLIIFSSNRQLVANVDAEAAIRRRLNLFQTNTTIFEEYLEQSEFTGPSYEATMETYLYEKYGNRPIDVVMAGGRYALDFTLRHRDAMFMGVPVVHFGVDLPFVESLAAMPAQVVGVPVNYDIVGTIRLALRLHPKRHRLVVVTGAGHRDEQFYNDTLAAVQKLKLQSVNYLRGLPTAELTKRLNALGESDVLYTPGYVMDGVGRTFRTSDAVAAIAAASNAPVYSPYRTVLGMGVVGGAMSDFDEIGDQAGSIAGALLAGSKPEHLKLPAIAAPQIRIDWRQAHRWGVDPADLPPSAIVEFREPSYWEVNRTTVLATILVIALEAMLIVALLLERRSRQLTEVALKESEGRMSLAARAAGLSVWVLDLASDARASRVRRQKTPKPGVELPDVFEHVLDAVHPLDRDDVDRAVRAAAVVRSELNIEYRTVKCDGEVRWIAARGRHIDEWSDRLIGVALDITDRKRAELQSEVDRAALTHMTRVSTMGQLAASIAHQLNQPLTAILGNAEVARRLIDREDPDIAELIAICDDIIVEDLRAAEIIGRLSALFRRGEMKFERLDLNGLVMETLDLVKTELLTRHVSVTINADPSLREIDGSRIQLQQVLLNLIMNAAEAMSETELAGRRLIVLTEFVDGMARLCVVDRGTGLEPGDMNNVFSAFWSTKATGIGVGLAVAQSIMTAHGGTLTVTNNSDVGATFCASWPARQPQRLNGETWKPSA